MDLRPSSPSVGVLPNDPLDGALPVLRRPRRSRVQPRVQGGLHYVVLGAANASERALVYAARAAEHAAKAEVSAARAAAKVGHPASQWWAVGAGLGAAMIVGAATLLVAWLQRKQGADQFAKQLAHDREQRTSEITAAGDRLAEQLSHDRRMRDLDHLRAELATAVAHAQDSTAVTELKSAVEALAPSPTDQDDIALKERHQELLEHVVQLADDAVRLAVAAGEDSDLVERLGGVLQTIQQVDRAVRGWDGRDSQKLLDAVDAADNMHTEAVAEFVRCAFGVAGALSAQTVETGTNTGTRGVRPGRDRH